MTLVRRLAGAVRALLRHDASERELDDELQAYLAHLVEQKVSTGMRADAAQRAARAEMGSLAATKDAVRAVGWESAVEALWQDVRYAARVLRRSPLFTIVAIVTLALGIGANSAIFTVVNGLVRPLPVSHPQRLALVSSRQALAEGYPAGWVYPVWQQIGARADAFDGAVAWSGVGSPERFNLAQRGEADLVNGVFVSGNFFTMLGVPALLGRTFTPGDDARGGGPDGAVAVISYGLWQRRFGGAADVIDRTIVIERAPFTIVGVTPPHFLGLEAGKSFDVAVPIGLEPLIHRARGSWIDGPGPSFLSVAVRLKPNQSFEAATGLLRQMQAGIYDAAHPDDSSYREAFLNDPFILAPLGTRSTSEARQAYERPFVTLLIIVSIVLLIACANIANLLLSRAAARHGEMCVRAALGASRWRLARQMLVESSLLAAAGALAGLLVAAWGGHALVAQLSRFRVAPVAIDAEIDWPVVAFTAATAIVTLLLFGLAPAIRAAKVAPAVGLRGPGPLLRPRSRRSPLVGRGGLVAAQVALSIFLLVAAGLFVRTFDRLASRPTGYATDRVLIANVDTSHTRPTDRAALTERLITAAARVPGVVAAAAAPSSPLSGSSFATLVEVPGAPPPNRQDPPIPLYMVTPGWFDAYGATILAGRDVSQGDRASSEAVVLVNESFARKFFPDGRAVGRSIRDAWAPEGETQRSRTIIGVVGDSIFSSARDVIPPMLYQPLTQSPFGAAPPDLSIAVRSAGSAPMAIAVSIARALADVDRELSFEFRTLEDRVNASIAQERLVAVLSAFFGVLALILAAVGLYGLTSYAAAQRRSEIGIRIALGARRSEVITLVLRRTLTVTAAGIVVGLAVAAAGTRYLRAMLYEVSPIDPVTFVGVTVLFAVVASTAAFVPARRAAIGSPLMALRAE
jgi:predicted permease